MQNRYIATTLQKGLKALQVLGDSAAVITQAELAKRTGNDRAIVRRLCLTLVAAGFTLEDERLRC